MQSDKTSELIEMMFRVANDLKGKMSFTSNLTHLSILQIRALHFIDCSDKKVSMTDIAEYFGIELPSATSLLNKLYDQKFVERLTDPNDRRLVIIKLTKIGKEILDLAMQERRKKIEELFSYLSEKEKLDLLNIFRTLDNRVVGKNI